MMLFFVIPIFASVIICHELFHCWNWNHCCCCCFFCCYWCCCFCHYSWHSSLLLMILVQTTLSIFLVLFLLFFFLGCYCHCFCFCTEPLPSLLFFHILKHCLFLAKGSLHDCTSDFMMLGAFVSKNKQNKGAFYGLIGFYNGNHYDGI